MAQKSDLRQKKLLKLPDDFLGTVQAFLQTPPLKKKRTTKKRKSVRKKSR
ncbi:MAG TPA: hypothetical protein VL225_21160 [Vicinamibacterales bacterium]|jgi:hypothetical protein|nr:hypothetical protein [Vicinamibacterales bacterium]